jgi:GMP synthase (glutamine-hydrolysing)
MADLRIALLNAAHEAEDTRRNFRREVDADLVEFHAPSGEQPSSFDFDGCIVTGSRASVYWDEPWIESLKDWVGDAIDQGLPFLGVCYGHQLLADVLGGQVEAMDEYELGYREVEHTGTSPLFDGIDDEFTVFTTHSDHVAELPPGAEQIAENDYGIHGFVKDRVYAVQFHPEYDMETAESVASGKDLPDERIQRVVDGIHADNYDAACEAKRLFDNYLDIVRDVHAAERSAAD